MSGEVFGAGVVRDTHCIRRWAHVPGGESVADETHQPVSISQQTEVMFPGFNVQVGGDRYFCPDGVWNTHGSNCIVYGDNARVGGVFHHVRPLGLPIGGHHMWAHVQWPTERETSLLTESTST